MPPINVLIKPASSGCNMGCTYCFYDDVSSRRQTKSYGMMSVDTLECIVRKTMDYAEGSCTFAFQGGEPTLVGLTFYKELIRLQDKYKKPQLKVYNAIQTNGIVIDEEWAKFLSKNKFLVGLSMDGCERIHNMFRVDRKQQGTFAKVMETAKLFDQYKVEYNILTVVTKQLAENIKEVYEFNLENNFRYMQFIPCLDEIEEKRGEEQYSLTPRVYEQFLKDLFDRWYRDIKRGEFVYIRYFENLIQRLLGYYPEACGMMGVCTHQNVVEADGGVYPCDFYVMDRYCIGNLVKDTFKEIEENRKALGFIEASQKKDSGCLKCKWYNLCHGGCRRDRDMFESGKLGRNYWCTAYKGFFKYAAPRLEEIAGEIAKNIKR